MYQEGDGSWQRPTGVFSSVRIQWAEAGWADYYSGKHKKKRSRSVLDSV